MSSSSSDEDVKPKVESDSDEEEKVTVQKDAKGKKEPVNDVKKEKRSRSSSSDDDSQDEPIQSRLRAKKSKTMNIHSSSSEEEDSDNDKKKKKGAKGKKAPARSTKRAKAQDTDIEEGEVNDESEDDSDDDVVVDDGYDEQYLGDADDRNRLAIMTERERELEIMRRIDDREILKRRLVLDKRLRMKAKQSGKGGKKSLASAVDDTSARSKERRLIVEGKKDTKAKAIEDLRAAREEKKNRAAAQEKKRAAAKPRKRLDSDESDEDDDEEEEEDLKDVKRKKVDSSSSSSDDDDEDAKADKNGQDDASKEPVRTHTELENIRLSRFRLAKWMYLPHFPDLVKGFFVRVNFGDMEQGKPIYKIAEVLGVGESSRPYNVGEPGQKPLMTNVTLRLRIYEREKEISLAFISNNPLTEAEFDEFKKKMEARDMPLPTREHLEGKVVQCAQANKYQMTDADITKMLSQKEKLGTKPRNVVLRKAELVKMRDAAIRMEQPEEVKKYQDELDELEALTTEKDAPRQAGQTRIEGINRRNISLGLEALGKALSNREVKKEEVVDDPFTRRWGAQARRTDVKVAVKTEETVTVAVAAVPAKVDPFNSHNFHIDLNIDLGDFALPSSSFPRRGGK